MCRGFNTTKCDADPEDVGIRSPNVVAEVCVACTMYAVLYVRGCRAFCPLLWQVQRLAIFDKFVI